MYFTLQKWNHKKGQKSLLLQEKIFLSRNFSIANNNHSLRKYILVTRISLTEIIILGKTFFLQICLKDNLPLGYEVLTYLWEACFCSGHQTSKTRKWNQKYSYYTFYKPTIILKIQFHQTAKIFIHIRRFVNLPL